MGQIADDMIDGTSCSLCGIYFVTTHGYPVVCNDCWEDLTKSERKMHQRATEKEVGDEEDAAGEHAGERGEG